MITEAEIKAALNAFEDWICLDEHEHSMQCLAMRAALEAAAAVREHTLSIVSGGTVSITSFTVPMSTYQDGRLLIAGLSGHQHPLQAEAESYGVTQEMLDAGADELGDWDRDFETARSAALRVYVAMKRMQYQDAARGAAMTMTDSDLVNLLQVGPDGHVPGNTVEALIAWHKEAGRLREEWVRAKRMLVIIAKQSSRDEGAIPDMVVNAIGEAEYNRLCDEITDDEVRGLAYPSTTERTDDA